MVRRRGAVFHFVANSMKIHEIMTIHYFMNIQEFHEDLQFSRFEGAQK